MDSLYDSIKISAKQHGFELCGITNIVNVSQQITYLSRWMEKGFHASMDWFARNESLRADPRELLPGAQTVVVCGWVYSAPVLADPFCGIARYALGADYHFIIKNKLQGMLEEIRLRFPEVEGRCFSDSAPVLERFWAERAGIGWRGRNGLITDSRWGSFFTIGILLLDSACDRFDAPQRNRCGTCGRCVAACPTAAIDGMELDARKCLSYLTIEHRGDFSPDQKTLLKAGNTIFGCDRCVEVCPWNHKALRNEGYKFLLPEERFRKPAEWWNTLSGGDFRRIYGNTPLMRAGLKQIRRNLEALQQDASADR